MLINCDIGERGVAHSVDDQLMNYIDIANIACGGHAGDAQSVDYYFHLAQSKKVKTSVHLSYPDKYNFGRSVIDIKNTDLLKSLDQQYSLLSNVKTLKFHGALYNEANTNKELALLLMTWANNAGIKEILTPQYSQIEKYAQNIKVIHEVFVDRRYQHLNNQLLLKNRTDANALIEDTQEALLQYQNFCQQFVIIDNKEYKISAQTVCIHSDSEISMTLAQAIHDV